MKESQTNSRPRDARARILSAADDLFYGQGINSVGVDTIAATAGVTKRTLYHHFGSKEELVAAYVNGRLATYRVDESRPARDQILRAFEALARALKDDSFRGCAFINAVAELSDRKHPAVVLAARAKEAREVWFRALAAHGRARDPALLSKQLVILFDGTVAQFLVRRDHTIALAAIAAADALLTSAELT